MDAITSAQIIEVAGGPKRLAEALGMAPGRSAARISNWKKRGIPDAVVVAHYQKIQAWRDEAARRAASNQQEAT